MAKANRDLYTEAVYVIGDTITDIRSAARSVGIPSADLHAAMRGTQQLTMLQMARLAEHTEKDATKLFRLMMDHHDDKGKFPLRPAAAADFFARLLANWHSLSGKEYAELDARLRVMTGEKYWEMGGVRW